MKTDFGFISSQVGDLIHMRRGLGPGMLLLAIKTTFSAGFTKDLYIIMTYGLLSRHTGYHLGSHSTV